jgi:hypothetical protein
MRTYVVTTGVLFGLLALIHIWRAIVEGPHLATDPWYVLITLVAAGLSFWAWRLIRAAPRT